MSAFGGGSAFYVRPQRTAYYDTVYDDSTRFVLGGSYQAVVHRWAEDSSHLHYLMACVFFVSSAIPFAIYCFQRGDLPYGRVFIFS